MTMNCFRIFFPSLTRVLNKKLENHNLTHSNSGKHPSGHCFRGHNKQVGESGARPRSKHAQEQRRFLAVRDGKKNRSDC